MPRHAEVCLSVVLLALPVQADLIVGQVVDESGVGIAGVDIDVKNLGGGGDPTPMNDGTDANGFFATTIPAGLYRITFNPPPPPASTNLVVEVDDVVVFGTTDMGAVTAPDGVAISGRILSSAGFPAAGANLDVIDSGGENLTLIGDTTDAFGEFAIAAPTDGFELRIKTAGVIGPLQAPRAFDLAPTADLDLGDVQLEPGYRVEGVVVGPGGVPVENADLDFFDAGSGVKAFTPGDNTDEFGEYSVVVAAGEWRFDVCPAFTDGLVGHITRSFSVTQQNVAVAPIELEAGVVLTGQVTSFDGSPVAGADVDAERLDGTEIALCADNTNASGVYSVRVPAGPIVLEFEPPGFSLPLGAEKTQSTIAGNTVLDAVLPFCGAVSVGTGVAGSGGAPLLATSGGAPRAGNADFAFETTGALGGSVATLTFGPSLVGQRSSFAIPGFGGALALPFAAHGSTVLGGTPGVAGTGVASFAFPVDASHVGLDVAARVFVADPGAPGGLSVSNTLLLTFCD